MGIGMFVCEDPLLKETKYELTLDGRTLNIYRIFSSYGKNTGAMRKRVYVDEGTAKRLIRLLIRKCGSMNRVADAILCNMEQYRGERYSSLRKERWRLKEELAAGKLSLEQVRIASVILSDKHGSVEIFAKLVSRSRYLSINGKKVAVPSLTGKTKAELAYLAGAICGDGHITEDLCEMKIVDGHRKKRHMANSLAFLENLDGIIKRNFHVHGWNEPVNGNYYVFRYCSVALCRTMNCIYEIPKGNKSKRVGVPKIVKDTEQETLFWRGVIDADGSIRPGAKSISIKTTSTKLSSGFVRFCKNHNIVALKKDEGDGIRIHIVEKSIPVFAEVIGSCHPRKQKNLIEYLERGATGTKAVELKRNGKFSAVVNYLSPGKNNIYMRLTRFGEPGEGSRILNRLRRIKKCLNCNIVEVQRQRKNNHFYICSKKLLEEIKEHYRFVPLWGPFDEDRIRKLKKRWQLHG